MACCGVCPDRVVLTATLWIAIFCSPIALLQSMLNVAHDAVEEFVNGSRKVNATTDRMSYYYGLNVAVITVTQIIGWAISTLMVTKFSPKYVVYGAGNVVQIIGCIATVLAFQFRIWELFYVGLFLIGLGDSIRASQELHYLRSITPKLFRKCIFGIRTAPFMMMSAIGTGLAVKWGNVGDLQNIIYVMIGLSTVGFIGCFIFPAEREGFVLSEAVELGDVREKIGFLGSSEQAEEDVGTIKNICDCAVIKECFRNGTLRQAIVLTVFCLGFVALSGQAAAEYYSTIIFQSSGLEKEDAIISTAVMQIVQGLIVFVLTCILKRFTKRQMLLGGLALTIIFFAATCALQVYTTQMAIATSVGLGTASVLMFGVSQSVFKGGPDALIRLVNKKLTPERAKQCTEGLATLFNTIVLTVTSYLIPYLLTTFGLACLLILITAPSILIWIYLAIFLPELSKSGLKKHNKTLEANSGLNEQ